MNEPHWKCEERHYWSKRFKNASWFFLILSFVFIFVSSTAWSSVIGLGASVGFTILNAICDARHQWWHIQGGDNM